MVERNLKEEMAGAGRFESASSAEPMRDSAPFHWPRLGIFGVLLLLLGAATFFAVRQTPRGDPYGPAHSLRTLDGWLAPVESNRILRLPSVSSAMRSTTFLADGQRGWAVGSGGAILATRDGGATWQAQDSRTSAFLWTLKMQPDGQRGWAAGSSGTVLATQDGGASWRTQRTALGEDIRSISMQSDGLRGWVAGSDGVILETRDGGTNWEAQTSGTKADLRSISMHADGKHGWATGGAGTILETRDGGKNWEEKKSGTRMNLQFISMHTDGKKGWAVGEVGTILETRDGGQNWEEQKSGTRANLRSISMHADGQRGWAVGEGGAILATHDGGANWQMQKSGTSMDLWSISMQPDGQRGWVVGDEGTTLVTHDAGANWQPQIGGRQLDFMSMKMQADGLRGWIVGREGLILATRNGGADWQLQNSGTQARLAAVQAEGQNGWIVGEGGLFLTTRDGGAKWREQEGVTVVDITSISMLSDGKRGWAVGDGGTILATQDGGENWQAQTNNDKEDLAFIYMLADGKRGWATGPDGTIRATQDGGATWEWQDSGTRSHIWSINMHADGQRGWAVSADGLILATRDGGAHWQQQSSGTNSPLWSISMMADGQRGWVAGKDGTILATRNGGASWQAQTSATKAYLWSISMMADGLRGWVVGDGGTILETRDGGNTWSPIHYRKYPAPWYWLVATLLLVGTFVLLWRALVPKMRHLTPSIVDKSVTDEPIASVEQDRLAFAPLALGLSRYLRNAATLPPLTVSISAPWGRGKSSLMRMLQSEMDKEGVKSVWFNAWHHQKEDVILASLLDSIRSQALPPWLSVRGQRFRFRLLWRRMLAHPWSALGIFCVLLYPLFHLVFVLNQWLAEFAAADKPWVEALLSPVAGKWRMIVDSLRDDSKVIDKLSDGKLGEFFTSLLATLAAKPEILLDGVGLLALAIALYALCAYGLRAFPDSPAVLLASVSSRFKLGQAEAQTGYRQKFKMHFADVCNALAPRTMLIFIDDLDRCEPGKTAEVLEAVNYLVNSGPCFVVLGMARDIVEAQLAFHYKDVADAYAELRTEKQAAGASVTGAAPAGGNGQRLRYVQSYLRKLINLDVRVPSLTPAQIAGLLEIAPAQGDATAASAGSGGGDTRGKRRRWIEEAGAPLWKLPTNKRMLVACALAGGVALMYQFTQGLEVWNKKRLDAMNAERVKAQAGLEALHEMDRRGMVALDYARGREKRVADELFREYGIAVAGLEFKLPLEMPRAGAAIASSCADTAGTAQDKGAAKTIQQGTAVKAKPQGVSAPGDPKAAATSKPLGGPPAMAWQKKLEVSEELGCWRKRALETLLVREKQSAISAAVQAAVLAKDREDFARFEKKNGEAVLAWNAIAVVFPDMGEKAAATGKEAASANPRGVDPKTSAGDVAGTADAAAQIIDHRLPPTTAPYWAVMLAMLILGALYVTRRDGYVIVDEPRFKAALGVWHRLLAARVSQSVPREVKRFQNRARYYAMRLRAPVVQRHWIARTLDWFEKKPDPVPDAATRIPEELIVGMAAVYQAEPEILRLIARKQAMQDANPDNFEEAVLSAYEAARGAHNNQAGEARKSVGERFAGWPPTPAQAAEFLIIAEEFEAIQPKERASAAEPKPTPPAAPEA